MGCNMLLKLCHTSACGKQLDVMCKNHYFTDFFPKELSEVEIKLWDFNIIWDMAEVWTEERIKDLKHMV